MEKLLVPGVVKFWLCVKAAVLSTYIGLSSGICVKVLREQIGMWPFSLLGFWSVSMKECYRSRNCFKSRHVFWINRVCPLIHFYQFCTFLSCWQQWSLSDLRYFVDVYWCFVVRLQFLLESARSHLSVYQMNFPILMLLNAMGIWDEVLHICTRF